MSSIERPKESEGNDEFDYEIENKYLLDLKKNFEEKFKKDVNINVEIDQTLIGGLKIQLADKVWDLSLKSKLEKMALALIK